MKRIALTFSLGALLVLLSGCGSSSEESVRQWMVDERNQTKPHVEPIPAPKQFKPEPYTNSAATEPFSKEKLTQALRRDSNQVATNASLVAPELARRKEPLEAYPLDAMTLVGSILKEGRPVALVMVDKLLYQVQVGSYLGQNYGRVMKIAETEVTLREIVQDAAGEWIERATTLQLQEKSK